MPARLLTAALAAAACLAGSVATAPPGLAAGPVPADPAVVTDWNAIAARTIVTENATPVPASGLYFGFVGIAVHDAVATIDGRHRTYSALRRPRGAASPEVAAATAAHRVLTHYFPASAANLAADYAAFLAGLPSRRGLFGARSIDLTVSSSVTGTSRHYATAAALDTETRNARIWLGFHFRKAMTDGNRLGHRVSAWTARHHFEREGR